MATQKKNFKSSLDIACADDKLREVLHHIIFHKECAVCTDAHVLVRQHLSVHDFTPEEIIQMEGKCIHKETFKEIFRYDTVSVQDGFFICTKGKVTARFKLEELDGKYPNYEAVIPKADSMEKVAEIGFDFKILEKVKKLTAGSTTSIRFKFHGENKAVLLRSIDLDWYQETILVMPKILS